MHKVTKWWRKKKKFQHESIGVAQIIPAIEIVSVTLAEWRYFTLLFVVVVFSFMRALLADLHHRTKIIFEKLTNWLIRINSLLLLKSEQNKTSCICFHNEKILETVDIETTKQQANTWMGTFNHSQKLIRGWNV